MIKNFYIIKYYCIFALINDCPSEHSIIWSVMIKRYKVSVLLLPVSLTTTAQTMYNVLDFGARGNGNADGTKTIQDTINRCSREGKHRKPQALRYA